MVYGVGYHLCLHMYPLSSKSFRLFGSVRPFDLKSIFNFYWQISASLAFREMFVDQIEVRGYY